MSGISGASFSSVHSQMNSSKSRLNLVALMDIFTILVFFLLLNSGDSSQLEKASYISLPDSTAKAVPHVDASITIGDSDIWFNDRPLVKLSEMTVNDNGFIEELAQALGEFNEEREETSAYEEENGFAVTIAGDKSAPYSLIESIMNTCSAENYRDISLAVNNVPGPKFDTFQQDVVNVSNDSNSGG
ncbi:ExbD/TolR family protein [Marinibactrum halimedae]|nr:biopolymer transporter ExbD [Marinibactrum halimedae]MCD9457436.1 biopolymer transporter ExbD [Marinibactrum halimedae]